MNETIIKYICEHTARFQILNECITYQVDQIAGVGVLLGVAIMSVLCIVQGIRGFWGDFKFYKSRGWDFQWPSGLMFGVETPEYLDNLKWSKPLSPRVQFFVAYPSLVVGGLSMIFVGFF